MQKYRILLTILICFFSGAFLRAQESDVSGMVSKMYEAQCEIIERMKTLALCDSKKSYDPSFPDLVKADMKLNGVALNDFKASRNLALNRFRHSSDASDRSLAAFFDGKDLPAAQEYPLFNDYVKAQYALRTAAAVAEKIEPVYGNAKGLPGQMPGKVRVTSNSPEPVTGGNMWMFSNGIRVIYRQDKNARDLSYTFMFRGGFGSISGLSAGQGACIGGLLPLYRVRGMSGPSFSNMLALNGISMDVKVSLMDMRISGSLPYDSLPLLMEAMIAMSAGRQVDNDAYEAYRAIPRHTSREAVIDSLLRPDFAYTPYAYDVSLPDDLMERAEKEYFNDKFSNFDDGIIIMTGSQSEYQIQSVLGKYLGAFRTDKKYAVYPQIQYQQRAGTSYHTGTGDDSVTIAMSMFLSLTSETYIAARLAQIVLQNAVRAAFPGKTVKIDADTEIFPYERYTVRVTVDGAGAEDIGTLRSTINGCSAAELTPETLKDYKAQLTGLLADETSREDVKADLAISRYTGRKDLLSNTKDRIDKMQVDQVLDMLEALAGSGSVEYVGR